MRGVGGGRGGAGLGADRRGGAGGGAAPAGAAGPAAERAAALLTERDAGDRLELCWQRDGCTPYDLCESEGRLAVSTDDYEGARALHRRMNCICYEDPRGSYYISDPDGYWLEILPRPA